MKDERTVDDAPDTRDGGETLQANPRETTPTKSPGVPADAPVPAKLPDVPVGIRGLTVRSVDELKFVANVFRQSGFAPQGLDSAEKIAVAIIAGMEVGLPPWQAVQNSAVINGKHSFYGDAILALANVNGLATRDETWLDGVATCVVGRRFPDGSVQESTGTFSLEDANQAGLTGKAIWKQYPRDMCMWKARHRAIKPLFADAFAGISFSEEVQDYDPEPGARPLKGLPGTEAKDDA